MERYNLPVGGIEVNIGGNSTDKPSNTSAATKPAPAMATRINQAAPPRGKLKPLRYLVTRALILVGTFAVLGNIPVHSTISMPSNDGLGDDVRTALHENQNVDELSLPTPIETYAGYEVDTLPSPTNGEWSLHQVERGQTLADILAPLKLKTDSADLMADDETKKTLASLKAENRILVQVSDRTVKQLIYATGKRRAYIVSRQDGNYSGKWDTDLFEEQNTRIAFTIRNPFHYEANKAGLPIPTTRQLSKIFKGDVNFRRIAVGDQVSVIFEDYYYQSERIFTNDILAAEFNHRGEIHQRIRFTMADGKTSYLTPNADLELKQIAFDRSPLKGARMSSGFGYRRHPVLGYRRLHTGTDFAAPHGTPIRATGSGTVRYVGRKGGYGKAIELSHGNGITTLYGHMSQYQKGLHQGNPVKRGDVIGYVGSTGTSTGNHVHYEFRDNGTPKNPLTVALPETGILSPQEMKDFKNQARSLTTQLLRLRETAAIDRNVRQQFGG